MVSRGINTRKVRPSSILPQLGPNATNFFDSVTKNEQVAPLGSGYLVELAGLARDNSAWHEFFAPPPSLFAICLRKSEKMPGVAEEVWIAATYATAIVFEVVKVVLASDRPVRDALLGEKQES